MGLCLLIYVTIISHKTLVYANDSSPFQTDKFVLPRYLMMPKITFRDAPSEDFPLKKLVLSSRRFHNVAIIASWSERSKDLIREYNTIYEKFEKRDVGLIALVSHDTEEGLKKLIELTKPKFYVGFATEDFIDTMKNPSVPTVWTIDNNDKVINTLTMPELDDIKDNINNILKMTNF